MQNSAPSKQKAQDKNQEKASTQQAITLGRNSQPQVVAEGVSRPLSDAITETMKFAFNTIVKQKALCCGKQVNYGKDKAEAYTFQDIFLVMSRLSGVSKIASVTSNKLCSGSVIDKALVEQNEFINVMDSNNKVHQQILFLFNFVRINMYYGLSNPHKITYDGKLT
ncbi:hypothetical protein G9A89_009873 [Geosiphon pyriformis]|nr:hypothetical protein G9A89_009873 [Geosiphon pyriformis]